MLSVCIITKLGYDDADRVLSTTSGYGTNLARAEQTVSYTDNGQVATLADAKNNLTTFSYDGFDRLVKMRYPSATTAGTSSTSDYAELVLDAAGNVKTQRLRGYAADSSKGHCQTNVAGGAGW